MASLFLSTPYTPIFPPPLPKKPIRKASRSDDDDSSSCHHHQNDNNNNNNDVPYIQKLKQRYLRLASVPHELCAPSREISLEAQTRIDSNRSRIRSRREMRLPLELALTCVGVAGGDWVGESLSEDNDDQYILPHSEAEWFQWERRRKALREKRKAERQAEERRNDIAKWTEGIQLDNITPLQDIPPLFPELESLPVPVVEPSPPPAAPVLEPLHDFNDSISGNSAPSLPFSITAFVDTVRRITAPSISLPPAPVLIPPSPPLIPLPPPPLVRPTMIEQSRETFLSQNNLLCGSNPQLSSPISPPRSLKPLSGTPAGSFPVSSKRLRQDDDDDEDKNNGGGSRLSIDSRDVLETPRPNKRFKAGDEPITPKSVERPSLPSSQLQESSSQPIIGNEEIKRLPTLMDLIANSSRKSSRRGTPGQRSNKSKSSHTPRHGALGLPELLPPSSQLSFSMFLPQAESTQVHDLPPP